MAMEIFNLNKANKSNISDTHSGFRAFTREAYDKINSNLKATGMEFATEMLEIGIKIITSYKTDQIKRGKVIWRRK